MEYLQYAGPLSILLAAGSIVAPIGIKLKKPR